MVEMIKPYAIVLFLDESKEGKKVVDIVPQSWLTKILNNKWNCYFPPVEVTDVQDLVKKQVTPDRAWMQYPAEVIKTAGDYKQGLRRLSRAYADLNVESTVAESPDTGKEDDFYSDAFDDDDAYDINEDEIVNDETVVAEKKIKGKKWKKSPSPAVTVRTGIKYRAKTPVCNPKESELVERLEQMEIRIAKQIKGAKQSILYDFNKKVEELKSTVIVNQAPGVGTTLKQLKQTLGVSLPFTDDDSFKEFNKSLHEDDAKDIALRAVMVELAKSETEMRGAVRKILGGIIAKVVQELYSAAGRTGANGKTKQSLSATHVYGCMKDVIIDLLPDKTTPAAILSATSRYLSGAGDREGGKKARDEKKISDC